MTGIKRPVASDTSATTDQIERFRRVARDLECEDDEAVFQDQVRKVAVTPKPDTDSKPD